jgi:hypothetical protein
VNPPAGLFANLDVSEAHCGTGRFYSHGTPLSGVRVRPNQSSGPFARVPVVSSGHDTAYDRRDIARRVLGNADRDLFDDGSLPDDAPRGLEFLLSANRLNVATSRARCAVVVVGSPKLMGTECRSPRQMKLVNAICRYGEPAARLL